MKSTYHNTTAHFNSYFIAQERILEVEDRINQKHEWNYNTILPIYAPFDSTTSQSLKAQLDDCIEKASMAIQRHPESRWEDNAYILVGMARLYGSEFPDAIETFKYVNTNGDDKDDRHTALIMLFRTFIIAEEYNNAIAVSDYLKKQEMNRQNLRDLYLTRAYYYQQREDFNNMVQNLTKAEELMSSSNEKARIDFIIGQVYQQLGFEANAHEYYKQTLKKSKTYELSFYTRLNMAQVTQLSNNTSIRRIEKYFKKLIKDPKNKEYLDRVYYELGDFNLKQGDLDEAIVSYNKAVQANGKSRRQKGMAYHRLGSIYYDSLKNFELAKAYYDSTIQFLPTDEKNYTQIKKRQEVLEEFVKHLNTIVLNDSLVSLASMSPEALDAFFENQLDILEAEFNDEKERRKKERRREAISNQNFATEAQIISLGESGSGTWYFYNPAAVSQGQSEFKRVWGERERADNWRRKNKSVEAGGNEMAQSGGKTLSGDSDSDEDNEFDREVQKNEMVARIPKSDEEIGKLLIEIENAYYALGNIYHFKLYENKNAITSFTTLLVRFPKSEYQPEVLYQLYLLNKPVDSLLANRYKEELKSVHPQTLFAKLVDNPNYREESKAMNDQYKKIYEKAYTMYKANTFDEVMALIDSALYEAEKNDYTDNLTLLRAMTSGKIDGIFKYQYELNNFIQNYRESDLVPYAEKLVKASEDHQINLYSSSRAKYIENFDVKHYFIFLYPSKSSLTEKASNGIQQFIKENKYVLSTGNLVLNESYAMVLINDFKAKGSADLFYKSFMEKFDFEPYLGERIYPLVISYENFNIFYETKDLQSYLTFFEKHYAKK